MSDIFFVLGGARSGKSELAERLAAASGERVLFVATMSPGDSELRERVSRHRRTRPLWDILEEPLEVVPRLRALAPAYRTILLDCLTLWVSNLMLHGRDVEPAVHALLDWAAAAPPGRVIVVSNEVGSGVVPASTLGRAFRDELGRTNRLVAARSAAIYYLVAGMTLDLTALRAPARPEGTDDPRR